MAVINLYTRQPEDENWTSNQIHHDGSLLSWINVNINPGQNIKVYEGELCEKNEISRDIDRMSKAETVSVFIIPSGLVGALIVSLVISVGVALLTPKPEALQNVNRQQQSKNNSLSDRRNEARPNQRIVDICGEVNSIPDIIQPEFARYDDNIETRIGCYVFGRNQLAVKDIKDGASLISETLGSSAGVYYPYKSPNNSTPDIQIGEPINEKVVGVYQSNDAIGQTMLAKNEGSILLSGNTKVFPGGFIVDGSASYLEKVIPGDAVNLEDVFFTGINGDTQIGANTHIVISVTETSIAFDITDDPSWSLIPTTNGVFINTSEYNPTVSKTDSKIIGPFNISTIKVDRLLVNIYAPNGMYRDTGSDRVTVSVDYVVRWQRLDDSGEPIGSLNTVSGTIGGSDSNEKGSTTEIELGSKTYVRWEVERTSDKDLTSQGSILDEIKLKDTFGLFDIDRDNFGNVTMIQTSRTTTSQTTAIREPQVNAICTELVYKYENGAFATELTENKQGMQSLIRLALDPRVGRRQESELDLDLQVETQSDCEEYFGSSEAGEFNYSFDSTKTTAQETFFTIANAMFTILWREGRVLKSWFERPQSIPEMVFTHRSKKPDSETWTRKTAASKTKDSVEFKYIDDTTYTQEIIYIPEDRSGVNPLVIEIPGIKGKQQATWRALREYNKLIYQEIDIDFTATAEGRFVKPSRMISVVKGSRVGSYDGYIRNQSGLQIELSQDVEFTANDDHFIILKRRDGTTESIPVTSGGSSRIINLGFAPKEEIYTQNSALKTEFSFGNEARLSGELVLPQEINPSEKNYTQIKAINYTPLYYQGDPTQPTGAFDDGFDDGFS